MEKEHKDNSRNVGSSYIPVYIKNTGINTMRKPKETYKVKCQCCENVLEVWVGPRQVIFDIRSTGWGLWARIKHAFGFIFIPSVYQRGGGLWITPKQFRGLLKKWEKINNYNIESNK